MSCFFMGTLPFFKETSVSSFFHWNYLHHAESWKWGGMLLSLGESVLWRFMLLMCLFVALDVWRNEHNFLNLFTETANHFWSWIVGVCLQVSVKVVVNASSITKCSCITKETESSSLLIYKTCQRVVWGFTLLLEGSSLLFTQGFSCALLETPGKMK